MDSQEFVNKWKPNQLKERSASQEHWIDICRLLNQPTPAEVDSTGQVYCFERGAKKSSGGDGWADVWWKGKFAVEYKGKRKNLENAYNQLLQYRESLNNPPLLIVIDMDRFEVHTNFTGTAKRIFKFNLDDIASGKPVELDCTELHPPSLTAIEVLRFAFIEPRKLRPTLTSEFVTDEASKSFASIAESLRDRGIDPHEAAHFLMKCLFCLFAEDIRLLPDEVFSKTISKGMKDTAKLATNMSELFSAMKDGGEFALFYEIPWFNGGLFDDNAVIELTKQEVGLLKEVAKLDWSTVEPSIFGTLFERSLDPDKRSQLGAHYTGRDEIMLVIEPVILRPLRQDWSDVKVKVDKELEKYNKASELLATLPGKTVERKKQEKKVKDARKKIQGLYDSLLERLHNIKVLDPACGSGNFLYVALSELKELEKAVIIEAFGLRIDLVQMNPLIDPAQLFGIEINPYAHELAQVVVWIGYIQWHVRNGYAIPKKPILKTLNNIKLMDALLVWEDGKPTAKRSTWPEADYIVGNPPFIGGNKVRQELGDEYIDFLFEAYDSDVEAFADFSAYWHERARRLIELGKCFSAGLLATQGIRGGASRETLKRVLKTGDIFEAWSDLPWVLDGASVHVSIVCQGNGSQKNHVVDGVATNQINSDLSAGDCDLTTAVELASNSSICFMGPSAKAPFDIDEDIATGFLNAPLNVNGKPNSEVVRPVYSAVDVTRRWRRKWTIDFGHMSKTEAAIYEAPFEYVRTVIKPIRESKRRDDYRGEWWRYARPRTELRKALSGLSRFICTPGVSKHRLFAFLDANVLANQGTLCFARDDDYFFGVLHSVAHERWALRLGTQLREKESGARYTPTSCFETFPLPWSPEDEPTDDAKLKAISDAAFELNETREKWLNPTDLTDTELKKRTLTKLYNARPEWLHMLHLALDKAVFAAYGWGDLDPADLYATKRPNQDESAAEAKSRQQAAEEEMLKRLLKINHERAAGQ